MDNGVSKMQYEDTKSPPPGVPPWALGIAFLFSAFVSSFIGAWLSVSSDVREYLKNKKEIRLQEIQHEDECNSKMDSKVSNLNAQYATQLSNLLGQIQSLSHNLSEAKIEAKLCEKDAAEHKRKSLNCETKLTKDQGDKP